MFVFYFMVDFLLSSYLHAIFLWCDEKYKLQWTTASEIQTLNI